MGEFKTAATTTLLVTLLAVGGCKSGGSDAGVDAPGASNRSPVISGSPQTSVIAGQSYSFTPSASDPDGDNISFTVQNLPSWASFNSNTGTVSGTPSQADVASYANILISVSDGSNANSLAGFSIVVTQSGSGSVSLSWSPPSQNEDGSALTNLVAYKFYYGTSSGDYSSQVRVNNPGISSYVLDNLSPATYYIVATAVNGDGVESRFSNESSKQVL